MKRQGQFGICDVRGCDGAATRSVKLQVMENLDATFYLCSEHRAEVDRKRLMVRQTLGVAARA